MYETHTAVPNCVDEGMRLSFISKGPPLTVPTNGPLILIRRPEKVMLPKSVFQFRGFFLWCVFVYGEFRIDVQYGRLNVLP